MAIIDEYAVVRAGLRSWLAESRPPVSVVGSFPNSNGCLKWLAAQSEIGIVITEIQQGGRAPDMALLRALCAAGPAVVVHSRVTSDEVILSSMEAGANCFLAKSDGKQHFLTAIACVSEGRSYVGPHMAEALRRSNTSGRLTLSDREREVLAVWLQTESKDEAARLLHIAPATVRTHLQRVRTKYAAVGRPASTKSALLARAVADGFIGLSDLAAGQPSADGMNFEQDG